MLEIEPQYSSLYSALSAEHVHNDLRLVVGKTTVSFSQLYEMAGRWRRTEFARGMYRKNVVIHSNSDAASILSMIYLDGWVQSMVLLPQVGNQSIVDLISTKNEAAVNFHASASELLSFSEVAERNVGDDLNFDTPIRTEWIVPTSGTTGVPKLIPHSFASLTRTVKRDRVRGNEYCWGLLYDPFRFAGIQVLLQALVGHSSLIVPSDRSNLVLSISEFNINNINALSATPTLWRKLLLSGIGNELSLRQVTLGGEIADAKTISSLKTVFPDARIVHIYASTDAGVGFAVADGCAGFPASYVEKQLPSGGYARISARGELLLKKSYVYENEPAQDGLDDKDGWIATGDMVERQGDRFFFLGRSNGSINVGGNKVMPEEIEQIIREIDGVLDVCIRGRGNSITGQIVEAAVVPTDVSLATSEFKKIIIAKCRSKLAIHKVPGIVKFVEKIEVTQAGKVDRNLG
ncbi:MAG: AMP-binding protein [Pirellula sp.]|nr:AMP-binding protein [Pirellula sp.]